MSPEHVGYTRVATGVRAAIKEARERAGLTDVEDDAGSLCVAGAQSE